MPGVCWRIELASTSLISDMVSDSCIALSSLCSYDLKGFTGGDQCDRHAGEVLLETDQRHIDVLRRDLDSTTDATSALRSHQRGAAAAKRLEDDFAFLRVGLDDPIFLSQPTASGGELQGMTAGGA